MVDSKRILVVDDEEVLADLVRATLSRQGFEVDSALDGWSALAMIEKKEYDAILLDVRMPGMDGMALYRKLAEEKPHLLPRIVFMTGVDFEAELETFVLENGVTVLRKPFYIENLVEATMAVFGH